MTQYFERQRYDLWAELLLLVPIAIAALVSFHSRSFDESPFLLVYFFSGFSGLGYLCFYWMFTEVDDREIRVIFGYLPVYCWTASRRDIVEAKVVEYNALKEYGGRGIRGFPTNALCTRGNQGVLIRLKNGRTMLVGSQNPDQLLKALHLPNATVPLSTSSPEY